ncbi:CRISPR-associated endonuclease Cas3'' [Paenibacillus cisolokensis]|uniref:CRISPR-associated endonuclease Cas3'' n=1 Tax=Paenibacillus cisolokensis TaxID=1658519 RepID=UPI0027DC7835|nr:CRISPR-associated endonuclease Cas3'' [Paenibacillus cisolokensis]
MDYIAHIREKDGKIQTTTEHSIEVKQACEDSGSKIGLRYLAGLSGWLHDMGKNTLSFKSYIEEAAANPDNPPRRGSVDHSTAGGKLLYDRFHRGAKTSLDKLTAECVANSIISHHQGLRDFWIRNHRRHFSTESPTKSYRTTSRPKPFFSEASAMPSSNNTLLRPRRNWRRFWSGFKTCASPDRFLARHEIHIQLFDRRRSDQYKTIRRG